MIFTLAEAKMESFWQRSLGYKVSRLSVPLMGGEFKRIKMVLRTNTKYLTHFDFAKWESTRVLVEGKERKEISFMN